MGFFARAAFVHSFLVTLTLVLASPAVLGATPSQVCQTHSVPDAKRLAVVIGNGAYPGGIGRLRNPANDASAISGLLESLGFNVVTAVDASAETIRQCIDAAISLVEQPQVALLYYSGHGIQIKDRNYLVAVDADPEVEDLAGFVEVQPLVKKLQSVSEATLIFLDACRNNPLPSDGNGLSVATGRNVKRGLVRIEAEAAEPQARGLFVAYATSPNAVALDGAGQYSPFTAALLKVLPTPGYSIQRVMSAVTYEVGEATNWEQTPWVRSSLTSELKLSGSNTLKDAQAQSENWARRATDLMNRGRRLEAIAAALKGLPKSLDDTDFGKFQPAHLALYSAVRRNDAWLPLKRPLYAYRRSDNGRTIAGLFESGGTSNMVQVWDTTTRKMLLRKIYRRSSGHYQNYAFSPDGRTIVLVMPRGRLEVWDLTEVEKILTYTAAEHFQPLDEWTDPQISQIEVSKDGRYILTNGGKKDPVRVLDLKRGKFVAKLSHDDILRFTGLEKRGDERNFRAAFATYDVLCLAMETKDANGNGAIVTGLYDLRERSFREFGRHENVDSVQDFSCASDKRHLSLVYAKDSYSYRHAVWQEGTEQPILMQDVAATTFTHISPDGRYVLASRFAGTRDFIDLRTGKSVPPPFEMKGFQPPYNAIHSENGEEHGPPFGTAPTVLWQVTPTGTALVAHALSLLPVEVRQDVQANRLAYQLPLAARQD